MIVSIVAFFFIAWSFGYTVLRLSKADPEEHPVHEFIAQLAVGLAAFSFLGVILNALNVPLHLSVYLVLGAIYPAYVLVRAIRGKQRIAWRVPQGIWKEQSTYVLLALGAILIFTFVLFHKGAFGYPYLENDDPWNHAQAAMYIARERTYDIDPQVRELNGGYAFYLEPYPPTYGIIMGLMRQANDSVIWTLKFFNVLLITLTLAFAFIFFKAYLESDLKAVFATFILAALPSFMSHFIWSQTLAIALIPVGLYATVRAINSPSWRIPAVISVASALVTQPVVSFVFGITVALLAAAVFLHDLTTRKGPAGKRFARTASVLIAGAGGLALSFAYWGVQLAKWGLDGILAAKGGELTGGGWAGAYALQRYTFSEVFFPPHASRIDQAVGWGPVLTIALVAGIIAMLLLLPRMLRKETGWAAPHMLLWFLLLAYATFAPSFGMPGWGSHRTWAYMAIPLAAVTAVGIFAAARGIAGKRDSILLAIIALVAAGIALTSIPAKAAVQTAMWPPGAQWTAVEANGQLQYPDLQGHLAMMELIPKNSRVFAFCGGDTRAIGFDMQADPWSHAHSSFRRHAINASGEEIVRFLTDHRYGYITVDIACARDHGENATNALAQRLSETGRFRQVHAQPGFILAQVS